MIPHLFSKAPLGIITNPKLQDAINQVKRSPSQEKALAKAYAIITARYQGKRFRTYIYLWKAWEKDPNKLWQRRGFMHCTQQNFLLRLLLVKSGWFSEKAVAVKHASVWHLSPHQYLDVNCHGRHIAVDPWGKPFGVDLGHYISGFGAQKIS